MRINTAIPSSLTGNVAIDLPSESAEQKLMLLRQFYSSPCKYKLFVNWNECFSIVDAFLDLNDTLMVGWSGPGFINGELLINLYDWI